MMETEHYRETLQALERDLQGRKARLEQHGREGLPADFEEQVDARANDEVVDALGEQVAFELAAVGAALQRIAHGTFGTCTRCGGAIARVRLDIIPYTPTCSTCA